MNFIPCVAWISKGVADPNPKRIQLSPEELKRLADETKGTYRQKYGKDDDFSDEESEEEAEKNENVVVKSENLLDEESDDFSEEESEAEKNDNVVVKSERVSDKESEEEAEKSENLSEEEDFDARYNLDSYDNDDEENPIFTINSIAVHVDNRDDEYLTDRESEDELEEKEDYTIKDSDNLLVVGHVEDESAVLEVYVYNQEEDAFYVHHDIVLPAYPLALEWLDFDTSDDKPGNYIAVGDMSPVIQIWDLDFVDDLNPYYVLGKMSEKKKAKMAKKNDLKFHSDAVLSLSWNKLDRRWLASGSADSSIIVWDLEKRKSMEQLSHHSDKVQALQWHPFESSLLLSGSTDGCLMLYDCKRSDGECMSWKVDGEIERVVWTKHDPFKFFSSTDLGFIHSIDTRDSKIVHSFQAHKEAVTGLDVSELKSEHTSTNVLISGSMDRTLKVWDVEDNLNMIKSYKLKVGSIYTAKAAPDLNLTVAVGGNYSSNNIKVIEIFKDITFSKKDESSSQAPESERNELNQTNIKRNKK